MGNYRKLAVWQRAQAFALEVYRSTRRFPSDERYSMSTQLRRGVVSVVSNIVEGSGRQGDREQVRFLRIARGSICEAECQLFLSHALGYLENSAWKRLDDECRQLSRMLNGLIRALDPKHYS